jgi:GLPGLI family protein
MKKTSFLFLLAALLTCKVTHAQETVLINVVYEFKYVRDLADKDNPYITNMVLSLGKNNSRYCSEKMYLENKTQPDTKETMDQQAGKESSPMTKIVVMGGPMLTLNKYGTLINEQILKDYVNRKLTIWATMGPKDYKIETAWPNISWKVHDEKKTIGKYNCQKATGSYGGRLYTAWFSPELHFQDGPWKLSGLPGLILEASDSRNEVMFTFKEISKINEANETTASLINYDERFTIKTNLAAYNRSKKAYETDPETFWSTAFPNATLYVNNIDDPNATHARIIKKYNPMELK